MASAFVLGFVASVSLVPSIDRNICELPAQLLRKIIGDQSTNFPISCIQKCTMAYCFFSQVHIDQLCVPFSTLFQSSSLNLLLIDYRAMFSILEIRPFVTFSMSLLLCWTP